MIHLDSLTHQVLIALLNGRNDVEYILWVIHYQLAMSLLLRRGRYLRDSEVESTFNEAKA